MLQIPCSPVVTSDRQVGDEAAKVTITVSQTCDGIAYSGQELQTKATQLLTHQAVTKLSEGYSRIGSLQVSVKRATITGTTPTLAFSSVGTWAFGLSGTAQEHLKHIIAGRVLQEALRLLCTQKGIQSVSLQWDANTKLPKDPQHIKFLVLVEM